MSEKFVVSANEIGEIIVTDVETDRVYRYGDISKFFGLIRLLNEQAETIRKQSIRIYCQDKEVQRLLGELEKIPKNIREVWLED